MKNSIAAKEKPRLVAKAALFFGTGTLSSRILGLIRDMMLISALPLDVKDAWLAAYKLPNFFRRMLGEGGLSASFIPLFVENHRKEQGVALRQLIDGVFTLLFTVSASLCAVAIVFMPELVGWWLSGKGFSEVPGKIELTVVLGRIMFGFLLCMSLFAYFMALLNGVKKFTLTGFAPVLFNASIIVALILFRNQENLGVSAAYGVLIGGVLQAAILVPPLVKLGLFPSLTWQSIFTDQVKRVLQRFMPTLLGLGVVQLMGIINVAYASRLESGAVTYIYMADRLLELPLSLIGVSIGTALLPTLSDYWTDKNQRMFSASVMRHMQLYLFLAIPAGVGLWIYGDTITSVLFVRGQFTAAEVPVVADILKVYSVLLLSAGCLRICYQAFYAAQDTLTPSIIAVFGLIVHTFMAPYWMQLWGVVGLCFSTALASVINLKLSAFLMHRRFAMEGKMDFFISFGKFMVASLAMGLVLYFSQGVVDSVANSALRFALLMAIVSLAAIIYFVAAYLVRAEESQTIFYQFRRRLGRRS